MAAGSGVNSGAESTSGGVGLDLSAQLVSISASGSSAGVQRRAVSLVGIGELLLLAGVGGLEGGNALLDLTGYALAIGRFLRSSGALLGQGGAHAGQAHGLHAGRHEEDGRHRCRADRHGVAWVWQAEHHAGRRQSSRSASRRRVRPRKTTPPALFHFRKASQLASR